jgi:putative nucleotidyltransferase with HDIG domain
MEREKLKRLIYARVEELPTLPTILPKVLKLVEREDSTLEELTDLVHRDQALTSKILKAANSAYYGFSGTISNLKHAVSLLGFRMVKSLTLSIGVMRALPAEGNFSQFSQNGLWEHSIAVATALRIMGKQINHGSDDLFTIGLLHDIGIVVQAHFFTDMFSTMLSLIHTQGVDQLEAEREVFCCDHGEIGQLVLDRWHFPKEIIQPVAAHHANTFPEEADKKTLAMLRVANTLPTELNIGKTGLNYSTTLYQTDLDELNMDENDLEVLKKKILASEEEIKAFSGAISSPA